MMMMTKLQSGAWLGLLLMATLATAQAESRQTKQFRFEVGADASASVYNQYGPVIVHSANTNVITVKATLGSDKVEVDPLQNGSHVELRSHLLPGSNPSNSQVTYELTVPYGTELNLRSSTGPLKVEKMGADVSVEGDSASVDVKDVAGAHVHVRTLDGDVNLTDIRQGHVEVMTVGGNVFLRSVGGPLVKVETTSGLIRYAGQFGPTGNYELHTYSGNIELTLPLDASGNLTASSNSGKLLVDRQVRPDQHLATPSPNSFMATQSGGVRAVLSGLFGRGPSFPPLHLRTQLGSITLTHP